MRKAGAAARCAEQWTQWILQRYDEKTGRVTLDCKKQRDAAPFRQITAWAHVVSTSEGRSACVLDLAKPGMQRRSGSWHPSLLALYHLPNQSGGSGEWKAAIRVNGEPIADKTFHNHRARLKEVGAVELVETATGRSVYRVTETGAQLCVQSGQLPPSTPL